jgi:hypothetical protein
MATLFTWIALASIASGSVSERVVLIAPAGEASEAIVHQVAGELRAAGFAVVTHARDSAPEAQELERIARDTESFAAIALWLPEGSYEAEVWVVDRMTGKTVLRRLDDPSRAGTRPSIFALRAVELLQASLLELDTGRKPQGDVAPSAPAERMVRNARPIVPAAPLPAPEPLAYALVAGLSVTGGPGGIPTAVAPSIGLGWHPSPPRSGQIQLTGPSVSTLEASEGSATIDQEMLLLRGTFQWLGRDANLGSYVVIGAGAYRLGARGSASPSYEGTDSSLWAMAATAGPGATLSLGQGLRLFVETNAVVLMPQPEVRFAGRTVALAGRPWLVGTFGVDVRW